MSAPGHIAIGTWARIGCNGCPSHFPFKKSSSDFMGMNYPAYSIYSLPLNLQDVHRQLLTADVADIADTQN